jgi:hypothetical protein
MGKHYVLPNHGRCEVRIMKIDGKSDVIRNSFYLPENEIPQDKMEIIEKDSKMMPELSPKYESKLKKAAEFFYKSKLDKIKIK